MDTLDPLRTRLISEMDPTLMYSALRTGDFFTKRMQEWCEAERTKTEQNSKILEFLKKRGPNAKSRFIQALHDTNQMRLYNLIIHGTEIYDDGSAESFDEFINAISLLGERSGENPPTSVDIYTAALPKSKLEAREIPSLMALVAGGYPQDKILGWPDAPSKNTFEQQLCIYKKEIAKFRLALKSLKDGGLHFEFRSKDKRVKCLVKSMSSMYLYSVSDLKETQLLVENFQYERMAPEVLDVICCGMHLACYDSSVQFIIRNNTGRWFTSYLIRNARDLQYASIVVADTDRAMIQDMIVCDAHIKKMAGCCPWG